MLKKILKDTGNIIFIWLLWSIIYIIGCSIGNKDFNYEKVSHFVITMIGPVAATYLFKEYLLNNNGAVN